MVACSSGLVKMDAMERMVVDHPYVFFNPSSLPSASFYPKPDAHFADSGLPKVLGSLPVDKARTCTAHSLVSEIECGDSFGSSEVFEVEEMNGLDCVLGDDLDLKSDARATAILKTDDEEMSEEMDSGGDEWCVDEILCEESVKMKLEMLAVMVGVDCSRPAYVLTEVIRVLRDLEGQRRMFSEENCDSGAKL